MQIKLQNFIPSPLAEMFSHSSDIWKKKELILNNQFITSIVSASGKGKSSLLSSIYGVRKDFEGTVFIDNTDTKSIDLLQWSEIRKNKLSMVFQNLHLFPELSALENITLKNSLTNHKSEAEILELMDKLGMAAHKEQSAASLSFGQQQRIAIIRALCQPYQCILLDEPFSHLDLNNAKIAMDLIISESKANNANIIITGLAENNFYQADEILNL